jgi:hypothetical protein
VFRPESSYWQLRLLQLFSKARRKPVEYEERFGVDVCPAALFSPRPGNLWITGWLSGRIE